MDRRNITARTRRMESLPANVFRRELMRMDIVLSLLPERVKTDGFWALGNYDVSGADAETPVDQPSVPRSSDNRLK
jgi:hypothetical protein